MLGLTLANLLLKLVSILVPNQDVGRSIGLPNFLVAGRRLLQDPANLAVAALAFVAALSLAQPLMHLGAHAFGKFPASVTRARSSVTSQETTAADLASVRAFAPFGVGPQSSLALATTDNSLSLRGVIQARPSTRSLAFISDAGRPAAAFQIGDALPGGFILDGIEKDHVVLLMSGQRETLGFMKSNKIETAPLKDVTNFGVPDARMFAPAADRTPDEVIDVYRRRIADDPKAVINDLGVTATSEGYKVTQLTAQLRRMGLKTGDLVVRINSKPVGNLDQDRANFEAVAMSDSARVEIMRDGRLLILSFPLR